MSDDNGNQAVGRPVDLTGDSAELVAFALLRYLAQIEQDTGQVFDRAWMLDAYAECLEAAQGRRKPPVPATRAPAARAAPARGRPAGAAATRN
jgi:hypothetical protein